MSSSSALRAPRQLAADERRRATRLRVWKPRPVALADEVAGSPNAPVEVVTAKDHPCATCGRSIVAGERAWAWKRPMGSTVYVCSSCDEPCEPAVRVDFLRLVRAQARPRVVRTGRAGRPAYHFAPDEVETIRRLRAEGCGEAKLARLFRELTGRRVSARKLAGVGRDRP